jgi:lipopolysaccharide transport system permease protein
VRHQSCTLIEGTDRTQALPISLVIEQSSPLEALLQRTARHVKVIQPPTLSLRALQQGFVGLREYGDLLWTLSAHRIRVRYKQSVLGFAWAILQPLSLMLIYTLVFSVIARVPSGSIPYAVFTYAALLPWTFFSTALTNATNGLVSHAHLVTKVYFPREILPFSYVIAALFDLLVASTVMAGLMFYYHVAITAQMLWLIPVVAVLTVFVTAVSLVFSATQVRFRDIGMAMPLLMQLWMFVSPVVYPLDQVPSRFRAFYELNPMVGIIESFRRVTVQGTPPETRLLALAAVISFALLPMAYAYFKKVEATVADVI